MIISFSTAKSNLHTPLLHEHWVGQKKRMKEILFVRLNEQLHIKNEVNIFLHLFAFVTAFGRQKRCWDHVELQGCWRVSELYWCAIFKHLTKNNLYCVSLFTLFPRNRKSVKKKNRRYFLWLHYLQSKKTTTTKWTTNNNGKKPFLKI